MWICSLWEYVRHSLANGGIICFSCGAEGWGREKDDLSRISCDIVMQPPLYPTCCETLRIQVRCDHLCYTSCEQWLLFLCLFYLWCMYVCICVLRIEHLCSQVQS